MFVSDWIIDQYVIVLQDNDHRVREASHRSLKVCAEKIRKGLAPHLRTLIGCWVAGMCDPHGPSATAARAAFESAFPPEKQQEVFKFSVKAIVSVSMKHGSLCNVLLPVHFVSSLLALSPRSWLTHTKYESLGMRLVCGYCRCHLVLGTIPTYGLCYCEPIIAMKILVRYM